MIDFGAGAARRSPGDAVAALAGRTGIKPWTPLQVRHAKATEVRHKFGLEGAQVTLGHSKADVTQTYAERDLELAKRIAKEIG